MRHANFRTLRHAFTAAAVAGALALGASHASAQVKGLELIAPASPGGGWDQHARAVQQVLQKLDLATGIQVVNIPGAGGTIGLAQFVTAKKRSPSLLVGGQIMVGAIVTNKSPVTLDQVTPLARLTGEYTAIVVPTDSPITSLQDILAKFKADPGSVSWGGGSAGGSDQILAGLIAKKVDIDPAKINYVATAGGGELMSSILGGHITLAMGGYNEFAPQIEGGKLRAVAVSSPERLPGVQTPTLKEQGVDIEFVNWRGVFAQGAVKASDKKQLDEMMGKMAASPEWKEILKQRGWIDQYQPADEFAAFLKNERSQIEVTLTDLGLVK
ncbi:C4-dicarboxylate ABC transporter substrate-binding protein [Skermanella stibiiresistens SB22]|uniref:C4-dicarboxylate ABC transporter substrate-binding protein n=1 Tax=Skermanella stibiiresistens SB22 TaxID=1385369 RepID=W9GZ07_9PROT|nr:tripartite tricarboxylate transporter substrate-binding protein [Skermanella stibiiresistens]EWY36708.1 C4-dicarboxylate ABC transporter substrate-binding protein [Skermanella stibiiresistens SB22]